MPKHKRIEYAIIMHMPQKTPTKRRLPTSTQRLTAIAIAVIAAIVIALIITQLSQPESSIAAYCKTYKQQNVKLAEATGDTYSTTVFPNRSSSDPTDFATAFSSLEQVAPKGIHPDVKTLQQIFQKIANDPSQALTASLSGLGAESNVKSWTNQYCD
jgi:hypothetical protein